MKGRAAHYLVAVFVALMTAALYIPVLGNEFVWDDVDYIVENGNIMSLDLAFLKWAFTGYYLNNWHPLTWMSHAVDYALWGLNPMGHHLTSVLLHAGNTFLAVLLCIKLVEAGKGIRPLADAEAALASRRSTLVAAAAAGLLFGLHPVHVESAAWITDRKDLLCALFYLLSASAYTAYVAAAALHPAPGSPEGRRSAYPPYLLSLVFFVLALLSKPMAVTLPVVLLLLDWYPFQRIRSWKVFASLCVEKLPFIGLSILLSFVAVAAQRSGGALELTDLVPLKVRLLVAASSLVTSLQNMAAPVALNPYYPYPGPQEIAQHLLSYYGAAGFLMATTAILFVAARRQKAWLCMWAYFLITFLPVVGIVQVGGQATADRYTYLPSLGPFLAIGAVAAWPWSAGGAFQRAGRAARVLTAVALLAVLAALSQGTVKQMLVWKNNIDLWSYIIEREPVRLPFAYNNRGLAFAKKGQLPRAIEDYSAAIAIDPEFAIAYSNRGLLYGATGEYERALEDYSAAIGLSPSDPVPYNDRGRLFADRGRFDRALADYNEALALNPFYPEAYNNRGKVLERQGLFDDAITDFTAAITLDSGFADAYVNRGAVYGKKGRIDRAIEDYTAALFVRPHLAAVYCARGDLYLRTADAERARSDFQKACDQGSGEGCRALSAPGGR